MLPPDFDNITPDELREYTNTHKEAEYLLVDVRQPREYVQSHIPGARLLPLGELGARLAELPEDRELVFYCRSGKRSQAAALFWTSSRRSSQKTYNLDGGILAWNGRTLPDFPRLEVFNLQAGPEQLLHTAMNLEKGAENFYKKLLHRFPGAPFESAVDLLARAEEGHARLIYSFLTKNQENPDSFSEIYDGLSGDVLEGGRSLAEMLALLDNADEDKCASVVELALFVEYAAYDLYRNLAHLHFGEELEKILLSIAQAEKEHMRIAADALSLCRD